MMQSTTFSHLQSKVKVRRASISEPSDTDHEIRVQSALQGDEQMT